MMANFNGNAQSPEAVYVPAEQYMHVAEVIRKLTSPPNAVPIDLLSVAVRKGALQLGDENGSYGVHMWDC